MCAAIALADPLLLRSSVSQVARESDGRECRAQLGLVVAGEEVEGELSRLEPRLQRPHCPTTGRRAEMRRDACRCVATCERAATVGGARRPQLEPFEAVLLLDGGLCGKCGKGRGESCATHGAQ